MAEIKKAAEQPDPSRVIEINGPPQAYFEIPLDGIQKPPPEWGPQDSLIRIVYRSVFALRAAEDVATSALADFIVKVKAELERISPNIDPIIWWRRHPSTEVHFVDVWDLDGKIGRAKQAGYIAFCRLETSPPLPQSWWEVHAIHDINTKRHGV